MSFLMIFSTDSAVTTAPLKQKYTNIYTALELKKSSIYLHIPSFEKDTRHRITQYIVAYCAHISFLLGNQRLFLIVLVFEQFKFNLEKILHSQRLTAHGTVDFLILQVKKLEQHHLENECPNQLIC